ncbi:MAG TPA: hypothetical protein VFF49_02870 [Thermodesulfobacteriota bacterium]|nr:hypothetical protein [Thermodesulfobacteriota bacterium]
MDKIRSIFSDKWVRRFTALFLVLGMSFFIATACDDDDCFFETINFSPEADAEECEASALANFCDDFEFTPPNTCFGFDCDICEPFDDDE